MSMLQVAGQFALQHGPTVEPPVVQSQTENVQLLSLN